ncbi:PEP-CTERM sorting domain-containing protein [Aquabacterium sp.]|uniref:PEP-CTERM sorting domain-containing protein n=1 Tax=Aquabacterium sp. TaxID=1872578 RepID=UPI003783E735
MRPLPRTFGRLLVAAGLAATGLVATGITQAAVVFSDTSMNTALFSATPAYTSPGVTLSTITTAGGQLQTSAGPLSGQTGYAFMAGYLYGGFSWDPGSAGAITSIDFSVARGAAITVNGVDQPGITLTGRALIEQGGQYFMSVSAPVAPVALPALTTIDALGLTQASFGLVDWATGAIDTTVNPDFGGGLMHFGFAARLFISGNGAADLVSMSALSDDFSLTLNTAAVPEPGSLALVALALLGGAVAGRRARMAAPFRP